MPAPESLYPSIESFVETAAAPQISSLFDSVRQGLGTTKGVRPDQVKKAELALLRVEELLSQLLQVREKLEAERPSGRKAKR